MLVTGEGFKTVQNPLMYMVGPDGVIESDLTVCVALNETAMICPSPAIKDTNLAPRSKRIIEPELAPCKFAPSGGRKIQQEPAAADFERLGVGFRMDAVESLENLGDRFRISVVPDPILCEFPNGRRTYQESGLVITGQRLKLAALEADVEVWVGDESCNITLLTADQILCDPPPNRPPDSSGDPPVRIRIGNLEFPLGQLAYDGADKSRTAGTMPPVVLIAIAVITLLVLGAVGLAVGIFWRRKTTQAEAEYKKIQLQMDSLESSVRQECKQGTIYKLRTAWF